MSIPYILTDKSLTVVINGKSMTMESTNPSFVNAKAALVDEQYELLEEMFDTPNAVVKF